MQVQGNTDRNIAGHEALDVQASGAAESTPGRLRDQGKRRADTPPPGPDHSERS